MGKRTGVWLVGARGGLATTVIAGTRVVARGLAEPLGLATAGPEFERLELVSPADMIFGGHEIRSGSLPEAAAQIARENGSIRGEWLCAIASDLEEAERRIRPGQAVNSGSAIEQLAHSSSALGELGLTALVQRLAADLEQFRQAEGLERVVVVNLASTEPPLHTGEEHATLRALSRLLDENRRAAVRASLLYACAALQSGCAYVNFTPSNAALVPAVGELARKQGLPFMGSDGKTGETLVKTALAPMFRHRALRVLSWEGYNMLGDRDGQVLSQKENLAAKVESKDRALAQILGYRPHTRVGIDYVPSLNDLKTAWDFIHFEGFLGFRMSMQFTWQGCDSILAAPLVLDLVRLADLALRRGEAGPLPHLAVFFKSPYGVDEHDLHRQWQSLMEYVAACAR
ncbi:MAG: inositol-3-phosphate synthase [Planctomycetes bacterium]|nr:inositol-3-phosphate synthase [Planctomycetota bacterium]